MSQITYHSLKDDIEQYLHNNPGEHTAKQISIAVGAHVVNTRSALRHLHALKIVEHSGGSAFLWRLNESG